VFVAHTINVYEEPLVNPDTVTGDDAAEPMNAPGVEIAVYKEIAEPPTSVGAVNATDAEASPPVAVPMVGASGLFNGSKKAEINPAGGRIGMMPPFRS
jgi:hypothetical protein